MSFRIFKTDITMSPLFVALLCILLLVDTTGLMISGLVCAILHESGHLCIMRICGVGVRKIVFYPCGIDIRREKSKTSYINDFLISAGGCIANIVTACICYPFLKNEYVLSVFISSIALCIFNLLPIKGLDGEQAVKYLLLMKFSPNTVSSITSAISLSFVIVLFVLSVCSIILYNISPLILICGIYLLIITIMQIRLK